MAVIFFRDVMWCVFSKARWSIIFRDPSLFSSSKAFARRLDVSIQQKSCSLGWSVKPSFQCTANLLDSNSSRALHHRSGQICNITCIWSNFAHLPRRSTYIVIAIVTDPSCSNLVGTVNLVSIDPATPTRLIQTRGKHNVITLNRFRNLRGDTNFLQSWSHALRHHQWKSHTSGTPAPFSPPNLWPQGQWWPKPWART